MSLNTPMRLHSVGQSIIEIPISNDMELTVIIISYNVSEYLRKCLTTVNKACRGIDCEIYVVDNNSDDNSCSMVSEEFPHICLIKNKINKGYSFANNQAIRLARGKYILLLNPDTLIEEDALTRCIGFMDLHSDAGALGVKMVNGEGEFLPESKRALPSSASAFFKSFGLSWLFPGLKVFNRYYMSEVGIDEISENEIISGAFMFIRRETLNSTGLLDEDYFIYGEDVDLSYRILEAGYKNYYFPEVKITHYKGRSTPRNKYDDIFNFYKAMRIYIKKRRAGGKFRYSSYFLIPGVYFREVLALLFRFFQKTFRK
ncbi:MAG TPA: glycosyl transferase family 2 [Bacteroidales bacterium]|nr:glycosyl transferase family 2 [Bacteroidales bacterium]